MATIEQPVNQSARVKSHKRSGLFRLTWLQWVTHAAAWLPLALLAFDAQSGNLTANPVQDATQRMGGAAILFLMLSLSITPLRVLTGIRAVQPLARPLGLYAFFYAVIHMLLYAGVDYGFDLSLLIPDAIDKKYIYLGIGAFLILAALAVTSFRWWMKRMGKRWKQLHRLVYAAGLLGVIHYGLASKGDFLHLRGNVGMPLLYAGLILLLLGLRIPLIRKRVIAAREHLRDHLPGR